MRSDPILHTMSMNTSRDQSLWSVLRENAALIGMYLLGTILFAFVRWPLGILSSGISAFVSIIAAVIGILFTLERTKEST